MKHFLFTILFLMSFTASADETIYKWTGANDELCTAIFPSGATEKADLKKCLLKAPIKYAWSAEDQKKCAAYTPNNIFVALTEESNCKEAVKLECAPTLDTPESKLRTIIDGVLLKIIPEVLALKDGDNIPNNILQEKDSRLVAASIIERLSLKNNKSVEENNENLYDFYNDSEIQISFWDKNFEQIRNNCFRNQFQTNTTKGADARSARQSVEKKLASVGIEGNNDVLETPSDISHHLRPKYAFFVPTKPMENTTGHNYVSEYGNIYAVLKDETKDRSTFTAADSLGIKQDAEPVNSKKDYKKIRDNGFSYWEAQIWGNVCFKDVSHFLVNCPSPYGIEYSNSIKLKDETIKRMQETGIPVYQCMAEQRGVNKVFTKGETMIAENTLKRKTDEAKADPNSNFPERRVDPGIAYKALIEKQLKDPEYLMTSVTLAIRSVHMSSAEGREETRKIYEKSLIDAEKMKKAVTKYGFIMYSTSLTFSSPEEGMKRYDEAMAAYDKTPEAIKAKEEGKIHLEKALAYKDNPTDPKILKDYQDSIRAQFGSDKPGVTGMGAMMGMGFGGGIYPASEETSEKEKTP